MVPLFRWAGSKRKLLDEIKTRLPERFGTYHEPFCGSACLFFDLLPSSASLSDMNEELINAYQQIQHCPENVWEVLRSYQVSKEVYYELRAIDESNLSNPARAARFIYLNRLCFNGVYRTNNAGKFNVPMGTKTGKMPTLDMLQSYSAALRNVSLSSGDFTSSQIKVEAGDLVYVDPPYAKPESRRRGEYGPNSFRYEDISRLIEFLSMVESKGATFVLSYSDCEIIRTALKKEWCTQKVSVRRHVAGFNAHRNVVEEILVTNCAPIR